MTNFLHSLLLQIPDDFKPWAALILGSFILVGLVLVHGSGIHWILIYHQRNGRRLWLGKPHHIEATILFGTSVFLMLGLHIFGAVDLDPLWRNISPIIGISGLFTFAWTTSALVGVVTGHNRLLEQLEIEREKQLELRAGERGAVAQIRSQETVAEKAARLKYEAEHPGGGVRGRIENWRGEDREIEAMREAERAKIADIRSKEGADEDKLGPGMPNE